MTIAPVTTPCGSKPSLMWPDHHMSRARRPWYCATRAGRPQYCSGVKPQRRSHAQDDGANERYTCHQGEHGTAERRCRRATRIGLCDGAADVAFKTEGGKVAFKASAGGFAALGVYRHGAKVRELLKADEPRGHEQARER